MYNQHFGLAQYPFSLTPNTRYFMKLPSHQRAFNLILNSLVGPGSFAKITGEVGTGKTMLCRKVLNALATHKNKFITAYIPHPILNEEGVMHAIAEELSLDARSDASYYDLLKLISAALLRFHVDGKKVILFIDEAQAMPEESLAAVQLLTSLETDDDKYLQVVLFGQPELDALLQRPAMLQIGKQMSFTFVLPSLDRTGTEAYIAHRLNKAGYNGSQPFSREALNQIFSSSKGVPRMINILAHKAMMAAYGKGDRSISADHVKRAIADTETARQNPSFAQRLFGDES